MNVPLRWLVRMALAASASSFVVCGGKSPSTPAPAPTPTPIPAPTPTPPPPDPPPLSQVCVRLGTGAHAFRCKPDSPSFLDDIEAAVAQLRQQKPELFDGDQVLNVGPFYVQLIKNLDAKGICSTFDGAEFAAKNSNDFNDQYTVLTSKGIVRHGPVAYQSTCFPAWFPLPAPPPIVTPGCSLPPSQEVVCTEHGQASFYPLLEAAIDKLLAEQPQLFDFNDVKQQNWPRVVNMDGYTQGIAKILSAQGLCARFDGREMQVKQSNDYNDQYAVLLSETWIRRGPGIYRGSCYPSAF